MACLEFINSRRALESACRDFFCLCRKFFSSCREFECAGRDVFSSCRAFGSAIRKAICPIPGSAQAAQEAKPGNLFPFSLLRPLRPEKPQTPGGAPTWSRLGGFPTPKAGCKPALHSVAIQRCV